MVRIEVAEVPWDGSPDALDAQRPPPHAPGNLREPGLGEGDGVVVVRVGNRVELVHEVVRLGGELPTGGDWVTGELANSRRVVPSRRAFDALLSCVEACVAPVGRLLLHHSPATRRTQVAKVRVHELAKELGVESKVVLEKLHEMGAFVKSASSTIEPSVQKRFNDRYGAQLRAAAQARAAGLTPRERPQLRSAVDDGPVDARAEAARLFGVPVHQLRPAHDGRPRRPRSSQQRSPRKLTSWEEHFFLPTEAAAWQRAGLGADDGRLAADLVAKGISPADLDVRVRGMRAGARLRGGEPPWVIVGEILEEKRRRSAG